ncbi:ribonuclease HI [Spiroplasma corruscae]|uniref:Ribonuclease H n=1 Tax=Spiroplasma corruscae TaxID=216934 RepID=A0A222EPT1_9MOLU|nr:ribonuclease H family protein [Spiroplasma corruscae]ASP28555.1 ribonuclease HI [Spiroplasma corruscae]
MKKKFYYAVAKGYKIGVFDSWIDCKLQIEGYKGSVYKKFDDNKEALKWLEYNLSMSDDYNEMKSNIEYDAIAYIDGSYKEKEKFFTYGVVIQYDNKLLKFKEKFNDASWLKYRNVSGEIMGAIKAIKFALENKLKSILIVHDYEGIHYWVNGNWKAKNKETKAYYNFMRDSQKSMKINFKWVKGHSNDEMNDLADELANEAYSLNYVSKVLVN